MNVSCSRVDFVSTSSTSLIELIKSLEENNVLTALSIRDIVLDLDISTALGKLIVSKPGLRKLELFFTSTLRFDVLCRLMMEERSSSQLIMLSLGGPFGSSDLENVGRIVSSESFCGSLKRFFFSPGFSVSSSDGILSRLSSSCLKSVTVTSCKLNMSDMTVLLQRCEGNLQSLELMRNRIANVDDVRMLVNALEKHSVHLRELNLFDNVLKDEGAKCVAHLLKQTTSLKRLNVGLNRIGPEGIEAICQVLKTNNKTLTFLSLESNCNQNIRAGERAFDKACIPEMLSANDTLKHLSLRNFGSVTTKLLGWRKGQRICLESLDLSYGEVNSEFFQVLAWSSPYLATLNLQQCRSTLSPLSLRDIDALMRHNGILTKIFQDKHSHWNKPMDELVTRNLNLMRLARESCITLLALLQIRRVPVVLYKDVSRMIAKMLFLTRGDIGVWL